MKWNISLNYSCDLLLSSFLSTKLYPSSDCVLSSVPLNLTSSLSNNCFNRSWHSGSLLVLLKWDCLQMSSQHLTTNMKVCFFICKDEEDNEDVSMQGQLCHKDWKIFVKAKKSSIQWVEDCELPRQTLTGMYMLDLPLLLLPLFLIVLWLPLKSLVRMLSYLKRFLWFYSSAIFFLQQFIKTV